MTDWFHIANVEDIASPALLLYPERIRENVRRMVRIAGSAARLRPHIKTHKLAELVRMQMNEGISKFKCATIAEAELAANAGARDVLIAYPLVGPNIQRLLALTKSFPETRFSCLADDAEAIRFISSTFCNGRRKNREGGLNSERSDSAAGLREIHILLDVDCGQHRTGVEPGAKAVELYRELATSPGITADGLHVYDGHLHEPDLAKRTALCEAAFASAANLHRELLANRLPVPRVVAGGLISRRRP